MAQIISVHSRMNQIINRSMHNCKVRAISQPQPARLLHHLQSRHLTTTLQFGHLQQLKTATNGLRALSQQAIVRRPYHVAKLAVTTAKNALKRHPLLLGAGIASTKAVLADFFAQTVIEKKQFNDLDFTRLGLFATLGIFYNGLCVYGIYAKFYPKIFPALFKNFHSWHTISKSLVQATVDVSVHATCLYFPFFYALKSCMFNGFSIKNIKDGLEMYFFENMWDDFKSTMSVWFPSTLIAFGYVPPYLRTPYMAMISFLWVVILSATRGAEHPEEEFEIEVDAAFMHRHYNNDLEHYHGLHDDQNSLFFHKYSPTS
jgi:hypothetical protein